MFERFDKQAGAVIFRAREEARLLGATKLEAGHILLALSRDAETDAGRILAGAGLDHDGLSRALDAELERSLEMAGIAVGTVGLAERPVPTTGTPRWGASAVLAIRRALRIAKAHAARSLQPTHILLGVLQAEEGTVPRMLAGAGVDGAALAASAEATLP
jgi:ATP-dependent Clp protease ATP-binding subunit ClpA